MQQPASARAKTRTHPSPIHLLLVGYLQASWHTDIATDGPRSSLHVHTTVGRAALPTNDTRVLTAPQAPPHCPHSAGPSHRRAEVSTLVP